MGLYRRMEEAVGVPEKCSMLSVLILEIRGSSSPPKSFSLYSVWILTSMSAGMDRLR